MEYLYSALVLPTLKKHHVSKWSSCHVHLLPHLVTSPCHYISRHHVSLLSRHHGSSSYFINMLNQQVTLSPCHVMSPCHITNSHFHSTSSCHVIMPRIIFFSSCHIIMSRHHVTSSCHANIFRHLCLYHLTPSCLVIISRPHISSSCLFPMSHHITQ